jgi:hypothetical protein
VNRTREDRPRDGFFAIGPVVSRLHEQGAMDRPSTPPTGDGANPWQPLLHRWFVQYNPIYLVSAMLVLGGMITVSRGLAHEGSLYGPLGVALVAEVYACSLIGGAALLTRIGQRRPAVILALITILYQSDLTLHTETCSFLGLAGAVASLTWLGLFVGKLYALAWALRIRLARRAIATAAFGALGLTVGPHVLGRFDPPTSGIVVAVFVFVLGSLYHSSHEQAATSLVPLDDWGRTVLRRSVRATWIVWAVLLALHVLFWSTQHSIRLSALVPTLALLAARRMRTESRVWAAVVSVLLVVLVVAPEALSPFALLAALTLAQRAFSRVPAVGATQDDGAPIACERSPYRARGSSAEGFESAVRPESTQAPARAFVPVDAAARLRLLSGALFGVYLSAWTFGWSGGALPAHVLVLDAALVTVVALMVWRLRARLVLAPLAATCVHGLAASGLVPPPRSALEWGGAAVALGFLLLVGSLATSYRLRHVTPQSDRPRAP